MIGGLADLQISEALALKRGHGGDTRRHELQKRVLLGLAEIDVVSLEGNLAKIRLDAELGEPSEALVEIGVDLVVRPRRAGEIVDEELHAGPMRDDDELHLH